MKKMKYFMSMVLILVMCLSMVSCGNKTTETSTKTGEEIGCYTQTNDAGETVLVDKDGKPVTDHILDAAGNVVDAEGNVVVKAADLTSYAASSSTDKGVSSDADKITSDSDEGTDGQKSDVEADEKDSMSKDDSKQDTKPNTNTEDKPTTKPSNGSYIGSSSSSTESSTPGSSSGSSTSESSTSDSSSGSTDSSTGNTDSNTSESIGSGNSGSSVADDTGSTTIPTSPTPPTKADIDCEAAMRAGNAYAESLGFEYWDGCMSYSFPVYFELECTPHTQERLEQELRSMVDGTKAIIEGEGRWHPGEDGWGYPGIKCIVQWNASAGYHELYVYFAG